MEVSSSANSNLSGLTSLLGVPETEAASYVRTESAGEGSNSFVLFGDWATLSDAGSSMARAAVDSDVRDDKVATVRASLASGGYSVPAHAVAASTVSAMLGQSA